MPRKGSIAAELWRERHSNLRRLYYWNDRTMKYGVLSLAAKRCLRDACKTITGMDVGPNEYWLPQIMSEAIEAAEALGL